MIVATRVLKLRRPGGEIDIPVRLHAPVEEEKAWSCAFEVGWPDGTVSLAAGGVDAVQAIDIALKMIGALIYARDHHAAGNLMWLTPGQGYGFPVAKEIRDVLVGEDREFL